MTAQILGILNKVPGPGEGVTAKHYMKRNEEEAIETAFVRTVWGSYSAAAFWFAVFDKSGKVSWASKAQVQSRFGGIGGYNVTTLTSEGISVVQRGGVNLVNQRVGGGINIKAGTNGITLNPSVEVGPVGTSANANINFSSVTAKVGVEANVFGQGVGVEVGLNRGLPNVAVKLPLLGKVHLPPWNWF
jgi:hypothetical protein